MKSKMNLTLAALLGLLVSVPVMAQPGPGVGGGPGMMQNAGPGAGMGPGGGGRGGMRWNQNNTTGWSMMTPEERTAHRAQMRSVKTYEECKQLQTEHRTLMEARAREKGLTLPTPRQNACERMQARGFFK